MAYEGFRVPNAAAAAFTPQARVFDQDTEILADGARGNGIVYAAGACAVLPQAAPNMTVRLTLGGTVVSQGSTATVTTGNVTIAAAHATLPRIDLVSVDNAGTKIATAGTAAAAPLPPVIPQSGGVNNVVLAFVYVPPADTAITADQITDKRIFVTPPGAGSGTVTTTPPASAGTLASFASGTSITNANLAGDVTTSGTLVTTIAAGVVTYAKMQDVSAASRIIGRGAGAGAGDPQELTLGTNLSMSGTVLNASGSGGSITVRQNTGADVGTRPRLNLIEGSNVTLTVADDAGGNEIDITIAASSGGGSSDVLVALGTDVVHATNSTTLTNVPGMTFSTTASATELWRVDVALLVNMNASGGTTADFKVGWTFPAGVTGFWASQIEREVAIAAGVTLAPSIATPLSFGGNGTLAQQIIQFTVVLASNGNAGAVQLQFAQNSLQGGSVVTVKRMSTLIARKVAA